MIPSLVESMLKLDYPRDKLQILLLIEEDDNETQLAINSMPMPKFFRVIIVPESKVKTKPNALNWGLAEATGEIVTIYDAEDRPDSDQLRKVVQKFKASPKKVICIQARLNFYNAEENLLTKLFAIEYNNLFNYTLPATSALGNPIPLGGTSNHFIAAKLRKLGGWDPYNVTEDADLGIRLAVAGYETRMVYSFTPEEAPINLKAWIKQRARWIKGHLHTYFVYMRKPIYLFNKFKWQGFLFFNYSLFLSPFLLLIMPAMFYLSIMFLPHKYDYEYGLGSALKYFTWFNLIFGYVSFAFTSYIMYLMEKSKADKLWWLYPFYFLLHVIAAVFALYKLLVEPHKWDKTTHGVSKFKK